MPAALILAAHFVALPWVTIALLVAGCLLLYHDLLTPLTWGTTGTLGVISVGAVFAAHLFVGNSGWLGDILLLIGLAAVLVEVHVWPGRGSALVGFMLMFSGMFIALGGTRHVAFALTISACLTVVSGLAFLAYLPKSPAWKRVGAQLHRRASFARNTPSASAHLIGLTGRSLTELRPSGFAEIDGVRVAVVTEGEFLDAGVVVVVTTVDVAGRIVVHDAMVEGGPAIEFDSTLSRAA